MNKTREKVCVRSEEDKCMGERSGQCLLLNRVVSCTHVCVCASVIERERGRERERWGSIKGIERYAILCFLSMSPNWG